MQLCRLHKLTVLDLAPHVLSFCLQEIFELFVKQLHGLGDTEGPYFSRYFFLLETLAQVKTCILLVEQSANDVIFDLFKLFFEIIKCPLPLSSLLLFCLFWH